MKKIIIFAFLLFNLCCFGKPIENITKIEPDSILDKMSDEFLENNTNQTLADEVSNLIEDEDRNEAVDDLKELYDENTTSTLLATFSNMRKMTTLSTTTTPVRITKRDKPENNSTEKWQKFTLNVFLPYTSVNKTRKPEINIMDKLQPPKNIVPQPSGDQARDARPLPNRPNLVVRSRVAWKHRLQNSRNDFSPVCGIPPEIGNGRSQFTYWYYDWSSRRCRWLLYSGAGGNGNRFSYRANCEQACVDPMDDLCGRKEIVLCVRGWLQCKMLEDTACISSLTDNVTRPHFVFCPPAQPMCVLAKSISGSKSQDSFRKPPKYPLHRSQVPKECRLPKDSGSCPTDENSKYLHVYEPNINDCRAFLFSGCGGNSNQFTTRQDCMDHCAY